MREVNVSIITDNIKEMCIEANHFLTDDMKNVFENAVKKCNTFISKCQTVKVWFRNTDGCGNKNTEKLRKVIMLFSKMATP